MNRLVEEVFIEFTNQFQQELKGGIKVRDFNIAFKNFVHEIYENPSEIVISYNKMSLIDRKTLFRRTNIEKLGCCSNKVYKLKGVN